MKNTIITGILVLCTTILSAQLFTHTDTAGIVINGDTVVSTASTAWDNSGGNSLETLGENGFVSAIPSFGKYLKLGLSEVTGGHNYNEYNYCFYVQPNGKLELYDGPTRIVTSTYNADDVLKIEKSGTSIIFYKNGVSIGTITNISETNLHVDYTFYHQNAQITFVDFTSDASTGGVNPTDQAWTLQENNLYATSSDTNVGIGTTNPGTWKLAVNGKIRAKEIKVETGWADFVFYDTYKLPTLLEVEQHINQKGHLKDIPSAKEVEENGIFLGQMDAKLLQKIEELTLYTIDQDKKIKKLESLNKQLLELQSRLEKLESNK